MASRNGTKRSKQLPAGLNNWERERILYSEVAAKYSVLRSHMANLITHKDRAVFDHAFAATKKALDGVKQAMNRALLNGERERRELERTRQQREREETEAARAT